MNSDKIERLVIGVEADTDSVMGVVDSITNEYVSELDKIMRDIQVEILEVEDPPQRLLESYFLTLTNAYYFIAPKCDLLGLRDDIAKAKAKVSYNNAYSDAQLEATANGKKATVSDLTISAEQSSLEDTITSQLYTRAFKLVKTKLGAAETMISTLSKIISSRMAEAQINSTSAANRLQ